MKKTEIFCLENVFTCIVLLHETFCFITALLSLDYSGLRAELEDQKAKTAGVDSRLLEQAFDSHCLDFLSSSFTLDPLQSGTSHLHSVKIAFAKITGDLFLAIKEQDLCFCSSFSLPPILILIC